MYVNPFWFGVAVTLIVQFALTMIAAIFKKNKGE